MTRRLLPVTLVVCRTADATATRRNDPGAPVRTFNPPGVPGADNDWVLKISVR